MPKILRSCNSKADARLDGALLTNFSFYITEIHISSIENDDLLQWGLPSTTSVRELAHQTRSATRFPNKNT